MWLWCRAAQFERLSGKELWRRRQKKAARLPGRASTSHHQTFRTIHFPGIQNLRGSRQKPRLGVVLLARPPPPRFSQMGLLLACQSFSLTILIGLRK